MAKMVGYACNIRAAWMKYARQLLSEGLSQEAYKANLNEYLSFEIASPVRLRKSREILMRVWYYDDENITPMRQEALRLIERYPDYEVAIGLCLIYLAYPVVADISKIIGKLLDYQDFFTNGVLKQKLYDEWGERGSLETTSRRVTLTLKDMGFVNVIARTKYYPQVLEIKEESIAAFLVCTAMRIDGSSYYPFAAINNFSVLYPFRYQLTKNWLIHDDRFVVSTYDGELSLSLNA